MTVHPSHLRLGSVELELEPPVTPGRSEYRLNIRALGEPARIVRRPGGRGPAEGLGRFRPGPARGRLRPGTTLSESRASLRVISRRGFVGGGGQRRVTKSGNSVISGFFSRLTTQKPRSSLRASGSPADRIVLTRADGAWPPPTEPRRAAASVVIGRVLENQGPG